MPAADEPVCWVCLDGAVAGAALLPQGCACRGTSGLAHVACIASAAQNQATGDLVHLWWQSCPTCEQRYTGVMGLELAQERWGLARGLPEVDGERLNAMTVLALALQDSGDLAAAVLIQEELVATCRRADANGSRRVPGLRMVPGALNLGTVQSIGDLGSLYVATENYTAALPLMEECIEGYRRCGAAGEHGRRPAHPALPGLLASMQGNLGMLHTKMGKLAAARSIQEELLQTLRETMPELAPKHMGCMRNLGTALVGCWDTHGGMQLLEEAVAVARRVFGPAHSVTQDVSRTRDGDLRDLQAAGLPLSCRGKGMLIGLASKPEHNGRDVCIVGFDAAKGRYQVNLPTTHPNYARRPMGIKPANIVLADASAVIVEGLQGATEWNGRRGLVGGFNKDSRRCASGHQGPLLPKMLDPIELMRLTRHEDPQSQRK